MSEQIKNGFADGFSFDDFELPEGYEDMLGDFEEEVDPDLLTDSDL